MFYSCSSLIAIPDISQWEIKKNIDLKHLFYGCSSLICLPDISKWVIDMDNDIKINTNKDYSITSSLSNNIMKSMRSSFHNCSSCTLDNISIDKKYSFIDIGESTDIELYKKKNLEDDNYYENFYDDFK